MSIQHFKVLFQRPGIAASIVPLQIAGPGEIVIDNGITLKAHKSKNINSWLILFMFLATNVACFRLAIDPEISFLLAFFLVLVMANMGRGRWNKKKKMTKSYSKHELLSVVEENQEVLIVVRNGYFGKRGIHLNSDKGNNSEIVTAIKKMIVDTHGKMREMKNRELHF